ncbi:MAG: hypothetical protein ACI389_02380 [Methanobrevibacter sp.]|uniref:hypothetical protein n=1 Tax=Methanobrevibacter sp. TaxID=66852 RepID=UPI003F0A0C1A
MISINDFKIIPECGKCKHADLYIPYWTYPYLNPRCSIHHRSIKSDDACEDFELIGRLSG